MKIATWNINGIKARLDNVRTWLEEAQPDVVCLQETRIQPEQLTQKMRQPPGYRAHLFISIHADGSTDPRTSGYRVAAPRRDATGRASRFVDLLQNSYGEETGLTRIPTVTHRMQNYYAFNFRRYEHALHPMTIGVIIETGFLTSEKDREVLIGDPETAARAIASAVETFPETPPPVAEASRSRPSGGS